MEKMRMESVDMTEKNIEKIESLFPNCITEALDENGKLKKAINFELLKQMLSKEIIDGDEAYEFTWVGKKAAIVEANKPIRKTLRPCVEESVNWDSTENLYIEGDNLDVLKLLQESYLGKIKLIYIDPPYNKGKDWIMYPDNFSISQKQYEHDMGMYDELGNKLFKENNETNPRFHSVWCSMMYQRLLLARNLLTEDGVIFISIDESEYSNIRNICNEIFGEKNHFGDLIWEATTQPINAGAAKFGLQKKTEPILLYGKNKSKLSGFVLEEIEGDLCYPHNGRFGKCRFEIIEKSDIGDYNRPTMRFKVLGQYPREGKRWQIGEDTARELERSGRVEIIDGIVKKAIYPEDELGKKKYKPFWSLFTADSVGTAQTGKEEFNSIMGAQLGFDTVKPTTLLKKLFLYLGDDYTILDFFSGTASTADAILQLNVNTNGHRNYIMVQYPEPCAENSEAHRRGFANVCDIGKERIRLTSKRLAQENPDIKFDGGVRVLKVDESNMNNIFYSPDEYNQNLLSILESNIKTERTALDLLFGSLLEWGLPLSLPYNSEEIDGCTIHDYNNGDLIACFDENIPDRVIKQIAKKQPLRAVFRDSSFANSPSKINVGEIFKSLAPDTKVKVI